MFEAFGKKVPTYIYYVRYLFRFLDFKFVVGRGRTRGPFRGISFPKGIFKNHNPGAIRG